MTMNCFLALPEEQQLTLIGEEGVYIGKRNCKPYHSLLFQLDCFYVEILYSRYRLEIVHMLCTKSTRLLDTYLDPVDIGLLVN
jgi:hypothetical protein